jgi:hypothetical protein
MKRAEAGSAGALPPLVPVETLARWLAEIFPEGTPHRNYVVREMAAKTIFVMLYCGAVEGADRWFRPAQATMMTDAQARAATAEARIKWTADSLIAGRLNHSARSWYAPNSREPIRDETLRSGLIPLGAVIERSGIPTTSSRPRYALSRGFHELLLALREGAAPAVVADWQRAHLSAEALARVTLLKSGAAALRDGGRLAIQFPNGETRLMLKGPSAVITKAVVEDFAPRFLAEPAVLFISDSGEKVVARDEQLASQIGLQIQADRNLPDVILVDVARGRERLIFIEVVATDGGITLPRKEALSALAAKARFSSASVFFVTAFADRSLPSFRRLAAELAWGTFAWFAAEPAHLLCFQAQAQLTVPGFAPPQGRGGPP